MTRNNIRHSLEDGISVNFYSSLEEGKTIANVTLRKGKHLIKFQKLQPKQDNRFHYKGKIEPPLGGSPDEESDGERSRLLVRAGAGLDGEGSTKLGQHPGLGSGQTLQMLLGTTGHSDLFF